MAEPNDRHDVPTLIFTQFLTALSEQGIPAEILARLSKALLEDKTFGEAALRASLCSEGTPQ